MAASLLKDFAVRLKTDYRKTLLNFLSLQVLNVGDVRARALLRDLRDVLFERGEPHPAALSLVLGMLLMGWAVKSYRTAHPPKQIVHRASP